jgi:hypothetical protein
MLWLPEREPVARHLLTLVTLHVSQMRRLTCSADEQGHARAWWEEPCIFSFSRERK